MASNILWNTWITFNVTLCRIFKFLCRGKAQLQWVWQETGFFILLLLSTKTLRLHTFFISYFWGKEILPEHFKQDYTLETKGTWTGWGAGVHWCVSGILRTLQRWGMWRMDLKNHMVEGRYCTCYCLPVPGVLVLWRANTSQLILVKRCKDLILDSDQIYTVWREAQEQQRIWFNLFLVKTVIYCRFAEALQTILLKTQWQNMRIKQSWTGNK